jgi:membrane protease YdiL (CAAX protease family)
LDAAVDASQRAAAPHSRPLSALEFALGAAVVIGHNVLRVLPNEVPILFLAALVSFRLREGWSALGFRRPASWARIIVIAVAAVALNILMGFAIEAITARFWPPAVASSGAGLIRQSLAGALVGLLVVWTFAAVGEEVGYRAYLTKRAADLGGGARWAWWAATLAVSVLFGFGHYYKGPAGVLDAADAGLIIGAAYLISGRNLWTAIIAHGLQDTIAVIGAYWGVAS